MTTPGSDALLGTFNANTTPTDAQAQQVIDDCVSALIAEVGELPTTVAEAAEIEDAARSAVEWRAAADIELAYPNRDADIRVYEQLNSRANMALDILRRALKQVGSGMIDVSPEWAFPAPPAWGDFSPGSGIEAITGTSPFREP